MPNTHEARIATACQNIDLATVNFGSLNRDTLRALARQHSVVGRRFSGTAVPVHAANKDELARGLKQARDGGKWRTAPSATSVTSGNVTIRPRGVVVFLKGKACNNSSDTYVAAEVEADGTVRIVNDLDPESYAMAVEDSFDGYEKFHTTLSDLKAFVAALA